MSRIEKFLAIMFAASLMLAGIHFSDGDGKIYAAGTAVFGALLFLVKPQIAATMETTENNVKVSQMIAGALGDNFIGMVDELGSFNVEDDEEFTVFIKTMAASLMMATRASFDHDLLVLYGAIAAYIDNDKEATRWVRVLRSPYPDGDSGAQSVIDMLRKIEGQDES